MYFTPDGNTKVLKQNSEIRFYMTYSYTLSTKGAYNTKWKEHCVFPLMGRKFRFF